MKLKSMNETKSLDEFSTSTELSYGKAKEELSFFNQYSLKASENMEMTSTSSGILSPTGVYLSEPKFYKDWYSEKAVNKQKLAFVRKYKPSFSLPLIDFDKSEANDGD